MTRIFIAAGALLLGTSSIALAADVDLGGATPVDKGEIATGSEFDAGAKPAAITAETKLASAKTPDAKLASAQDWPDGNPKLQFASLDSWGNNPKLQSAALESWEDNPKLQSAALDSWDNNPKLQSASLESWEGTTDNAKLDSELAAKADADLQTGMGGPLEESDATTTAALTSRPAAGNYPPCEPGPGDDNCIQLYEPGVRAQLAAWDRPTGGLADGTTATAMGGPYEPVADDRAAADAVEPGGELAMNGDGAFATESVSEAELASHVTVGDVAGHDVYQGVGGPIESQSGYPPCEPGPGDDRCIQLYERGVTGAGN